MGCRHSSVLLWLCGDVEDVCKELLPWLSTGRSPKGAWEVADSASSKGYSGWILGKSSSLKEQSGTGTRSPGRWWSHHSWEHAKNEEMWHFVMWLSGQSGIQSKVGLGGLVSLFQPGDSMIPCCGRCCLSFPTKERGLMMPTALRKLQDTLRVCGDGELVGGAVLHDLDVCLRGVVMKTHRCRDIPVSLIDREATLLP